MINVQLVLNDKLYELVAPTRNYRAVPFVVQHHPAQFKLRYAGGAREGAGRTAQTTDGGPLERKTVSVDATTVRLLTAYGDGEFSEGIRRAARAVSS